MGGKIGVMNNKVSFDCVATWWQDLTEPQKSAFAEKPSKVSEFLESRVKEIIESTFVIPLSDQEAIELLIQHNGHTLERAVAIVRSWRKYASYIGYPGPIAWKIRQGFNLKTSAPLVGQCNDDLKYLQEWSFTDTPTVDSLVFWVPRLAEASIGESITQMEAHRAEQRRVHNLPANHCDRFGLIALLFALVLAHFKRTGERVPLNFLYAASDTLRADGRRVVAGDFRSYGLRCYGWDGSIGGGDVGFFLLGVEKLGQPAQKAGE